MILFSLIIPATVFIIWYVMYGIELAMNGAHNDFIYNPIKHLENDLYNYGTVAGRKAIVRKFKIRDGSYAGPEFDETEYYARLPHILYPWMFHGLFFTLFTVSVFHILYRIFV